MLNDPLYLDLHVVSMVISLPSSHGSSYPCLPSSLVVIVVSFWNTTIWLCLMIKEIHTKWYCLYSFSSMFMFIQKKILWGCWILSHNIFYLIIILFNDVIGINLGTTKSCVSLMEGKVNIFYISTQVNYVV